jgi:glycosyltransferase involved in cell wall biosynthesis
MSIKPAISIIMPCYQQGAYLEEAARSVLDQRDVQVELIVMDPGSTDGSRELLLKLKEEYADTLILNFAPDKGQSDAINRGMVMARGNVLAWLNSDDRLRPGSLNEVEAYLNSPVPCWMYGRCGIINSTGQQIFRPIVMYMYITIGLKIC